MVQRVAYLSVMILGVMSALSGLVLWKSVQFPPLRTLLGGYEAARYIHFLPCRRWWPSSRFTVMVALVPRTLLAMLRGR